MPYFCAKLKRMKKIGEYRRLLGVDATVTLAELKKIYRDEMKACHPDRFQHDETEKEAAELRSREVIEAYHFLVSINPATLEAEKPEFEATVTNQTIIDYKYENVRLEITFDNGITYEYISVPKATYIKMINADSPARFAKRHILRNFPYRKVSNAS